MDRNITLYPWYAFARSLVFWQAVWFLIFQGRLSAAEAILLYAVYDIATMAMEVPSGYLSDRAGRRITLVVSSVALLVGAVVLLVADSFALAVLGQVVIGASMAFNSGTDTALLYESLASRGRQDDIERHEVKAWRFSFTALALSAFMGGALALVWEGLPFAATAVAGVAAVIIAARLIEPDHARQAGSTSAGRSTISSREVLAQAFRNPCLRWLFALSVLMYGFSHVVYVFGQPFIEEALETRGWAAEAPLISGAVTAVMMLVSLATSLTAPAVRRTLGLTGMLLLAFGMQIGLAGVLALTNSTLAIALLFLRMVPDSFGKPFIVARVQPELADAGRATYLSLQSFAGRLVFAAALFAASFVAPDQDKLAYAQTQLILGAFFAAGVVLWVGLALAARRAGLEVPAKA